MRPSVCGNWNNGRGNRPRFPITRGQASLQRPMIPSTLRSGIRSLRSLILMIWMKKIPEPVSGDVRRDKTETDRDR